MNTRGVTYSMMTTITLLCGISDKVVNRVNLKKKNLIIRKKYFFLFFGVSMRWWMLTKFILVIIHNVCKSSHYAVHLKLTLLLFSGQVLSNSLQLHGLYSPLGSSVHGIFQARILDWVAFPSPENLPNPGTEHVSPALAGGFFTTEPSGEPKLTLYCMSVIPQ